MGPSPSPSEPPRVYESTFEEELHVLVWLAEVAEDDVGSLLPRVQQVPECVLNQMPALDLI